MIWKLEIGNWKLRKKGFSLIEAVIASGILAMVAGASLSLAQIVLKGNKTLADRTQALYLATEALEVAQNVRDTNYIDENAGTTWVSGLSNATYGVQFDGTRYKLVAGASDTPCPDKDAAANCVGTLFNRTVNIVGSAAGQVVTVTVSWEGNIKQLKLSTYLTDSRQQ